MNGEINNDHLGEALFVKHPTRPIDLETVPLDGHEYIHKSRQEDTGLFQNSLIPSPEEKKNLWRSQARTGARQFCEYAHIISSEKDFLRKKFHGKIKFPKGGVEVAKKWCLFCLGSELYTKIYGESPSEELNAEVGCLPLLSIILRLNIFKIRLLLRDLYYWFLIVGMEEPIALWVYALLACLDKPLDEGMQEFLKKFNYCCKIRMKDCDDLERPRLYLISAIFKLYFSVNINDMEEALKSLTLNV